VGDPVGATTHAATHVASLMVARAVRAPLWLLLSALLARVLEPAGLGTWSMILAAAALLNQLLLFWTQSITQRFGRGEWLAEKRLGATWETRWPLVGAGLGIALLLVLTEPFDWPRRAYGLDEGMRRYILPAFLTLWAMAECQSLQQVRERFGRLAWSPVTADLVFLAALGVLLFLKIQRGGALGFDLSAACLLGVGLLTWVLWLASELPGTRLSWSPPSPATWRRAVLFAAPLIPGTLVGYFAEWCDYFLIRNFYSEHEVGLFHPAYQYTLILVGLPTAIATVLLPRLAGRADTDGGAGVRLLIERRAPQLTTLWILFSLPIVAILPAVFAWLLGPRYAISTELLRVLLVAAPGAIVSHIYGIAYFLQGRLGIATVVLFGVKGLVDFAVSFVLLPQLGVLGSALGSASSYVVLQWLFVLEQHRFQRLRLGAGGAALLLAHVSGVALACTDTVRLRLAVVLGVGILILGWARHIVLFTREEVSGMIPRGFGWAESTLAFAFCRADGPRTR
jgi:O-antigen/teichoic acid export membrane protein